MVLAELYCRTQLAGQAHGTVEAKQRDHDIIATVPFRHIGLPAPLIVMLSSA
jgi:hypothetical protein